VSLAFAPDGRILASISTAGAVIHWEAAHQIERGPASLPGGPVAAAALSPDGATLALGGADGTLSLWDVASSPPTRLRAASGGSTVSSLAFSPDGKQLAAGDWDRTIRLWDVSSMELDGVLEGHQDIVSSVAYSPDGRTLASGGADGAVLLWDLVNAAVRDSGDARRPTAWVWSLAFSPDGKTLAIGAADGSIALWDLGGRYLANRDLGRGKSFALSSSVLSLAFSPNGETLASGDAAGAVTLWDLANPERAGQSLSGHTGGVRAIVFSPSGNALASGATDGGVILWRVDPETQSEGRALYTLGRGASSIALSPDGTTLAFHDCDPARTSCGFLMLFDLQENQGIKAVDGDTSPISNLAFGPGGVRLAGQHSDGSISVWDMRPGGGRVSRLLSEQSVACLAFTADERALATAARDGAVTLWDINDGSTTTYQAKEGVLVTAFSPDGTLWATGYDSGMVTVRELASGEQIRETRHSSAVSALAFGPSGEALVIGSGDGTLLVWDLEADTTAVQPAGDQASLVLSLAYSRDGSRFAAGYASGALLLCAGRGQQPACLPLSTQGNGLVALAFRGDGRRLVVRDDAGTVLIRDLSVDAWVDRACHIVNRALTAREWEQFVAGEPYQPTCERAEKEEGNGEQ
jgi:WD40 repeat protein